MTASKFYSTPDPGTGKYRNRDDFVQPDRVPISIGGHELGELEVGDSPWPAMSSKGGVTKLQSRKQQSRAKSRYETALDSRHRFSRPSRHIPIHGPVTKSPSKTVARTGSSDLRMR